MNKTKTQQLSQQFSLIFLFFTLFFPLFFTHFFQVAQSQTLLDRPKLIIAHRGASGYLPEHTLEALAYAHAWGVHFIEPDVVLTKDNKPIILHDITLESNTNVETLFPRKKRDDGHYYAIDFTLAEIKTLTVHERTNGNTHTRYFPNRFPLYSSSFSVPTLEEYIELLQGLNKTTGKKTGLYLELKKPEFHRAQNRDLLQVVLPLLTRYGYEKNLQEIILQCFEEKTLQQIRHEWKKEYLLVQLVEHPDQRHLLTPAGMKKIATYAQGIGLALDYLYEQLPAQLHSHSLRPYPISPLVQLAHENSLAVHPFTMRKESIPSFAKDFADLHRILFDELKVDGLFSDFGDLSLQYSH